MNLLAEYRLEPGGPWLTVIAAPGDTYAELEAVMRRVHGAVDVRPREPTTCCRCGAPLEEAYARHYAHCPPCIARFLAP